MQVQGTGQASGAQAQPKRSTFVTVVAVIFITLMGLTTFVGIMQAIMLFTVFTPEAMDSIISQTMDAEQMPPLYKFMFAHMRGFVLGMLVMSSFVMVSAIGLLKRWNWARIAFIVFLVFGIVWNVSSVFLQFSLFSSMTPVPEAADLPVFQVMQTVVPVFIAVIGLAFAVLFGWIIKRLVSDKVKAEFGA